MSLEHRKHHNRMDSLEQAVLGLEDRPEFEFIMDRLKQYREGYISDLSQTASVENPQVLAHIAGCVSVLDTFLREVNDARTNRS